MEDCLHSLFFTCGRGLEKYVAEEMCKKYSVNLENDVSLMDGKVFVKMATGFPSIEDGQTLLELKSPERVFVSVFSGSPLKIKHRKEFWKLKDVLSSTTAEQWKLSYCVWKSLTKREKTEIEGESSGKCEKRPRLDEDNELVTFRVSCKCAGSVSKYFSHQEVSRCVCGWIRTNLSWQPDLKNPQIEIFVHLNNDYSIFGIPVTKEPLSKRSYLECIALRPTICWAMASLAEVKPTDVVLDPMCGAATLLTETVVSFQVEIAIGLDINSQMIVSATGNACRSRMTSKMHFAVGDARKLPILNEVADVVICDLPFGLKYGSIEQTELLIPQVLREMNRVLKPGGRIVLLISERLVTLLLKTASALDCGQTKWDLVGKRYVKLGELSAFICKFYKPS